MASIVTKTFGMELHMLMSIFWQGQRVQIPMTQLPTFFFLECSNGEEDLETQSLCCHVLDSSVDSGAFIVTCEYEGSKIVHPALGTYRGREADFEEMACGQQKVSNDDLIGFAEMRMEFVGVLTDDSAYFDPAVDSDHAESMNYLARKKEEAREFFTREFCA